MSEVGVDVLMAAAMSAARSEAEAEKAENREAREAEKVVILESVATTLGEIGVQLAELRRTIESTGESLCLSIEKTTSPGTTVTTNIKCGRCGAMFCCPCGSQK